MDWTIRLSYGVLLTSFTEGILYLAWQVAGIGRESYIAEATGCCTDIERRIHSGRR